MSSTNGSVCSIEGGPNAARWGTRAAWAALIGAILTVVGLTVGDISRPASVSAASISEAKASAAEALRQADEMIAHGGKRNTKKIIDHAEAMVHQTEAALKTIPAGDSHAKKAAELFRDAINHAKKVLTMGEKQDPGMLLNPALKARTALRHGAKYLEKIQRS